jgi:phosphotriesterase-related protein
MMPGELKGKIQTVLGPIAPETLGRTLMHEHVLCDIRAPQSRADNDLGPEITLENVWQLNYSRGIKRAGRKYMLDLEDIAGLRALSATKDIKDVPPTKCRENCLAGGYQKK